MASRNLVIVSGTVEATTQSGFWLKIPHQFINKRNEVVDDSQMIPVKAHNGLIGDNSLEVGAKVLIEGSLSTEAKQTFIIAKTLERL